MIWPLVPACTLVGYGNAVLNGALPPGPAIHGDGSEPFRRVNAARFTRQRRDPEITHIGAMAWYDDLMELGVRRLWFWRLRAGIPAPPPWQEAARRAGAGVCAIQADGDSQSSFWIIRDPQVRLVERVAVSEGLVAVPHAPCDTARERFIAALEQAGAFAKQHGRDDWSGRFASVVQALRSHPAGAEGLGDWPDEILPEAGYSDEARALLAAVSRAWVFGGDDGWEQAWPDEAPAADATRNLLRGLCEAVMCAANEFTPAPSQV